MMNLLVSGHVAFPPFSLSFLSLLFFFLPRSGKEEMIKILFKEYYF
jgi:hypothetical protein